MLGYKWLLLVMLQSVYSQTTKDPDEDKPYKFGFNIQGYQHRQEEKDERGIIKGEYGFITADGYYRVTVYATDENGDFRIISMKNYYVGFPPEDPTTTPGPPSQKNTGNAKPFSGSSGTFGGQQPGSPGTTFSNDKKAQQPVTPRPQGRPACSDCFIPTTTVRTNQGVFGSDRTGGGGGGGGGAFGGGFGFGQGPAGGRVGQFPQSAPGSNQRGPTGGQLTQGSPGVGKPDSGRGSPFSSGVPGANAQGSPGFGSRGGISPSSSPFGGVNQNSKSPGFGSGGGGSDGFGGSGGSGFPRGPNNFQNNQLDNGPRQRPKIGEVRDGLPPGVTLNDIKSLLYTFNYTVGFHGHHEDGYRNGDKEGDYFFDGRDGVERKVEYLANEFGYQPNITFIDLPENDIRRPKEETEKEYGLKGYEFKWFYRK